MLTETVWAIFLEYSVNVDCRKQERLQICINIHDIADTVQWLYRPICT